MQSSKGTLNKADWKKIGTNALVFLTPIILLYLTSIVDAIKLDGLTISDFYPNASVISFFTLYLINVAIDFLKKLGSGSAK